MAATRAAFACALDEASRCHPERSEGSLRRQRARRAAVLRLPARSGCSCGSALWRAEVGRVAAGGTRWGLMLWRSALRADSPAMLTPESRRRTRCASIAGQPRAARPSS